MDIDLHFWSGIFFGALALIFFGTFALLAVSAYFSNVRLNVRLTTLLSPKGHSVTHCRVLDALYGASAEKLIHLLEQESQGSRALIFDFRELTKIDGMAMIILESSQFTTYNNSEGSAQAPIRGLISEALIGQILFNPNLLSESLEDALRCIDLSLNANSKALVPSAEPLTSE